MHVFFAALTTLVIMALSSTRLLQLFYINSCLRSSFCGLILLHVAKVWAGSFWCACISNIP